MKKGGKKSKIEYADDDISSISKLLRLRIPPLFIGLVLGLFMSFITSGFEQVILKNIALAFFLPLIVYFSDAVGTQTQLVYVRDLKTGNASFKRYIVKETFLGIFLGIFFSLLSSLVVYFWFNSYELTLAVGISMFCAIATAPILAMIITKITFYYKEDPAVDSGPISKVVQDVISVVIYGLISSAIIL